jgi:hypothetical protein
MNNDEKNLLMNQVQTDVALISFLSVISVFFTGALLPKFDTYDISIKIPISFLIVATFALLISALILSNVSQRIVSGDATEVRRHLMYGYAISEYTGVFLFIISIPLTVNIITSDTYLRIVTFCAAMLGIGFYQFMGFSLLENHFSRSSKLFSALTLSLGAILFAAQMSAFHFTAISVIFLVFILLMTVLAPVKKVQ